MVGVKWVKSSNIHFNSHLWQWRRRVNKKERWGTLENTVTQQTWMLLRRATKNKIIKLQQSQSSKDQCSEIKQNYSFTQHIFSPQYLWGVTSFECFKLLNRMRFQLKCPSTWMALCSLNRTNHLIISMALSYVEKHSWESGLCIIFSCQGAKPETEVLSIPHAFK